MSTRGRPRKNASTQSAEQRERPIHQQGEQAIKHSILDEMEQNAQKRIAGGDRISLSPKLKLQWNDVEEGYNYQWASDSENYPINLQQMLEAGYTFVRHKHGQMAGVPVVQNSRGCNLYLMRCPQAFFEEDQKTVHEKAVRQYREILQVDSREYAGDSKELGKGKAVKMEIAETPEQIRLMEGE